MKKEDVSIEFCDKSQSYLLKFKGAPNHYIEIISFEPEARITARPYVKIDVSQRRNCGEVSYEKTFYLESEVVPTKQSANEWDDSLRYNCEIGRHYLVTDVSLSYVRNSYVITDKSDVGTTIFITGE